MTIRTAIAIRITAWILAICGPLALAAASWPQASHSEYVADRTEAGQIHRAAVIGWNISHPLKAVVDEFGSWEWGYNGEKEVDTKFTYRDAHGQYWEQTGFVRQAKWLTSGRHVLLWTYSSSARAPGDDDNSYDGIFAALPGSGITPLRLYHQFTPTGDEITLNMVGSWFAPEGWWVPAGTVALIALLIGAVALTKPERRRSHTAKPTPANAACT